MLLESALYDHHIRGTSSQRKAIMANIHLFLPSEIDVCAKHVPVPIWLLGALFEVMNFHVF